MKIKNKIRKIVYNGMLTPDGTLLESLHRHDYVSHLDANGKLYVLDGGTDYIRCSQNGDEQFITIYDDYPFETVRMYAYRLGYGKPGSSDFGKFKRTHLYQMSDEYLKASIQYMQDNDQLHNPHTSLLLKEQLFRITHKISIPDNTLGEN